MREREFQNRIWNRARERLRDNRGVTLAEMLIVIAITMILCAVAFIAVWKHQRSLAQLERDGIAKEIFVAAQNHLTAAKGEGYAGVSGYGTAGSYEDDEEKGVYYYTVNAGSASGDAEGMFGLMLPFGAIDETVRTGGSYIIRYQPETGTVMDVFYCTRAGAPDRFNHVLGLSEYEAVCGLTGRENRSRRRTYDPDRSVLGWYGGADAETLPSITLKPPVIEVVNAEKLYVNVRNENPGTAGAALKLIITGALSGAKKSFTLLPGGDARITDGEDSWDYTVILDDITTEGMHFGELGSETDKEFIPGEDVRVEAVSYSTSALANIAYSGEQVENSLFASVSSGADKAYIGNIRHLENLDSAISGLDDNDDGALLDIRAAEQETDMSWKTFMEATGGDTTSIYRISADGVPSESTDPGYYMPISPDYPLSYDGRSHSISDVAVNETGDGGLFGNTEHVSEISNLELVDFTVTAGGNAGALAGTLRDTEAANVLVRNSEYPQGSTLKITSTGASAGGLAGLMSGGSLIACGSDAAVNGGSAAGGLVGTASDAAAITACFSGGHTAQGSYGDWVFADEASPAYDVTSSSGTAGGLVGAGGNAAINSCYSTCSVKGTTAGGLAGSCDGSIAGSYATGLVDGTTAYAFLGSGGAGLSGNYYYSIVNETEVRDADDSVTGYTYLLPVSGYDVASDSGRVKALDADPATYEAFVGADGGWQVAEAYDAGLRKYYGGRYPLKTVKQLAEEHDLDDAVLETDFAVRHYGDWPAPEVFVINE